jgi:hypothetical protein
MGDKRHNVCQDMSRSAISKVTRPKRKITGADEMVAAQDFARPGLSQGAVVRLAGHILKSNLHLRHFEVEFGDEPTCLGVRKVLEEDGCMVLRLPFKSVLDVTCPEDNILPMAA